ncbi:hypothetical protein JCM18237_12600 [Halorubrum luteum]
MDAILKPLQRLFPDFGTARKERNRIRYQCKENLNALERGDDLQTINSGEYQIEYLHNRAENTCVQIDHLIKKYGSLTGPGFYKIVSTDTSDLESNLEKAITQIWRKNALSWVFEAVFIVFIVGILGGAVFLGIVGVDAIVDGLQRIV